MFMLFFFQKYSVNELLLLFFTRSKVNGGKFIFCETNPEIEGQRQSWEVLSIELDVQV